MTTLAQVKRAVKPLLNGNPDLALVGRWLIVTPVHHVVRGIVIDRTSRADNFRPEWALMHLFDIHNTIFLNWGSSQHPPHLFYPEEGPWKWSSPQVEYALHALIERTALPKLRSIDSIQSLLNELTERYGSRNNKELSPFFPFIRDPITKILFDVSLGNLDSARSICAKSINCRDEETYGRDDDDKAQLRRLKELCRLLAADDRAGMARLLHEWEAQTVRNLKIEHLWEPTPFPLEMMPH